MPEFRTNQQIAQWGTHRQTNQRAERCSNRRIAQPMNQRTYRPTRHPSGAPDSLGFVWLARWLRVYLFLFVFLSELELPSELGNEKKSYPDARTGQNRKGRRGRAANTSCSGPQKCVASYFRPSLCFRIANRSSLRSVGSETANQPTSQTL